MGMPICVEVSGLKHEHQIIEVFDYFRHVDEKFSPYKKTSELSQVNGGLDSSDMSAEMREVLDLCEQTKQLTNGYFDINKNGHIDTSGLVKGWAIGKAAKMLSAMGHKDFYVEAGGDIQAEGLNEQGEPWRIGIRNPFNINEIVKIIAISNQGVATSGAYIRGEHIYDPNNNNSSPIGVSSLTVIAPNIFDADRYATACFAMGEKGVYFIEALDSFEAYQINKQGIATMTKGFETYVVAAD